MLQIFLKIDARVHLAILAEWRQPLALGVEGRGHKYKFKEGEQPGAAPMGRRNGVSL